MEVEDLVTYIAEHYLRRVRPSGSHNLIALCPFHDDSTPSFSISLRTGQWICFTEDEGGSLRTLMERLGVDRELIDEAPKYINEAKLMAPSAVDELPLQLLGVFDWMPTALVHAGFLPSVLKSHRIGFDRRTGYERITFPVIDREGVLRGFSGRDTRGLEPRYKFYTWDRDPSKNDFYGIADVRGYAFKRNRWLWRENKISLDSDIVLAEGFKAALWLAQHGYDSVASMGTKVSPEQVRKIQMLRPRRIFLFLDGDKWGVSATTKTASYFLAQGVLNVFVCGYPEGKDEPDALTPEELERAFITAKPATIYLAEREWRNERRQS